MQNTEKKNEFEAARYCGLSVASLRRRRWLKQEPTYIKVGGRVLYDLDDLESWLDRHRITNGAKPEEVAEC